MNKRREKEGILQTIGVVELLNTTALALGGSVREGAREDVFEMFGWVMALPPLPFLVPDPLEMEARMKMT